MRFIQNIQALRGVAVLFVVLVHLVSIEQKYGGAHPILPTSLDFGIFGVDLFFVISGFIMVTVTRGKFQNTKQALRFLYHRASRIYPTYWVYSLLVLAVFLVKPTWVNSAEGNQVNIISSFLLFPSDRVPLVMVGWTLIHEMYFYLIYFLFLLLIPEKHLVKAVGLWGLTVAGVNVSFDLVSPLANLVFHPLTIEFVLGCFVAVSFYRTNDKIFMNRLLQFTAFAVLLASMYGYDLYFTSSGGVPGGWWRVLIFGLPATAIVFCFINLERNGLVIHSSLIKIGDASYSIYLSHILTLSAVGRVWKIFSTDSTWDNYVMIPILFIASIIVGMLSYRYIEKPLLAYTRKVA